MDMVEFVFVVLGFNSELGKELRDGQTWGGGGIEFCRGKSSTFYEMWKRVALVLLGMVMVWLGVGFG